MRELENLAGGKYRFSTICLILAKYIADGKLNAADTLCNNFTILYSEELTQPLPPEAVEKLARKLRFKLIAMFEEGVEHTEMDMKDIVWNPNYGS